MEFGAYQNRYSDNPAKDVYGNIIGSSNAVFPLYNYELRHDSSLQDFIDLYEMNLVSAVRFPNQTIKIIMDQKRFLGTIINLRRAQIFEKYCNLKIYY